MTHSSHSSRNHLRVVGASLASIGVLVASVAALSSAAPVSSASVGELPTGVGDTGVKSLEDVAPGRTGPREELLPPADSLAAAGLAEASAGERERAAPGTAGWVPELPERAPSREAVEAALAAEATGAVLAPPGAGDVLTAPGAGAVLAAPGAGAVSRELSAAPDQSSQNTPLLVNTSVAEAVRPGGTLQYEIRYTNTLGSAITSVVIEDTLSQGQEFDGTYQSTPNIGAEAFSRDGLHMEFRLGALAPGASGVIRLTTQVADRPEPSAEQSVILVGNSVRITGDGIQKQEDAAVATVVGPILELTLLDGPDPVLPGHTLVYTLALRNIERQDAIAATGMVISAVLPTEVEFLSASVSGQEQPDTGHVVWQRPGPLEPGTQTSVSVAVRVSETLVAPKQLLMDRDQYVARSSEVTVNDVLGKLRVSTLVQPLLAKEAEGPRRFGAGATAYPGDPVTYTLTVNNPRDVAMNGVVVSDTIPGDPGNFQYAAMLEGPEPTVQGNVLKWTSVDLPPLGSVTYRYTALVPRDAFIQDNSVTGTQYPSAVSAIHPSFRFPDTTNTGPVRVFPPVITNLQVSESRVQAGSEVVYTITLQNRGPFPIGSIRLTDTMKGEDFRFVGMESGPNPEAAHSSNPVVWTGISVPAGGATVLSFAAIANGFPLQNYLSDVEAWTPETFIPARRNAASVRIDSPLRIMKVAVPDTTYLDTTLRYDLELTNVTQDTWTMSRITDTLPAGFYHAETGRASVALPLNPPVQIAPEQSWTTSYNAYLSGDIDCSRLPTNVATLRGQIEMEFTNPLHAVFANAANMATVNIRPHVSSYITATRQAVQPGDTFLYELRLKNQTGKTGTNAELRFTIPEGFTYVRTVEGPVAERSGDLLRFPGIQITPNDDRRIILEMRAGQELGNKIGLFEAQAEGVFCIERLRGAGRVQVLEDVVLLETKPLAPQTSPGGLIDFQVRLTNKDPMPYPIAAITDTMPSGFEFVTALESPEPNAVQGNQIIWRNVVLPGNSTTTWRVRMKASTLFGAYENRVAGHSVETRIRDAVSDPVEVMPMIQLEKVPHRTLGQVGGVVGYTITLLNLTRNNYTTISITDVLPAGMTYEQMIVGPPPTQLGAGRNRPTWSNLSVAANGGIRTLAFEARLPADALEGQVIYNEVVGHSPDVLIPGTDRTAPITITHSMVPTPTVRRPTQTPEGVVPTNTPGGGSSTSTPGPTPTLPPMTEHIFLPWASRP